MALGKEGDRVATLPPQFMTQVLGPLPLRKRRSTVVARKRIYSRLFEGDGAKKTIKWALEGSKSLCGIYLKSLRP